MTSLKSILCSIDWRGNIEASFKEAAVSSRLEGTMMRLAVWSKQLEIADASNPALCFTREMQLSAQHAAANYGLCLYKDCAAAARTMVETSLYYTYFRCHPEELVTLEPVR